MGNKRGKKGLIKCNKDLLSIESHREINRLNMLS